MSSSQHWLLVRDIVERALDLREDEREAFLQRTCDGDDELLVEVRELLLLDTSGGQELTPPHSGTFGKITGREEPRRKPLLSQVGRYELLEELGRGGMGVVYLARRVDGQLDRHVAVKLIRRWIDSEEVLQRFERERQVLASLEHPGIARLIDGGMASDGRPYLVMEYVEGKPIDVWCDEQELSIDERLELFREVCAAVDAAHRSLVVHRDLKPSNILVTTEGRPKLLDFGIAKVLAPTVDRDIEDPTRTRTRRLTPAYASPEQVRGEPITTASDTYSLGVTLYLLLTGHLPLRLTGLSPAEMERTVCEEIPPPPGVVVQRPLRGHDESGAMREVSPEEVCARRGATPQGLARHLNGDLGTIVLKALRKERERRYASATELAEDLRRFLAGLPVSAQPDTWRYLAKRFTRRNRKSVLASLIVLAALVVGFTLSTWQFRKANEARRQLSDQLRADQARAAELQELAEELEEARQTADEARDLAEGRATQLEERAGELREETELAQRERERAERNLVEVREANVQLEVQQSLVQERLEALRHLTHALLSDVQQAVAPVEHVDEVKLLILRVGLRILDRLTDEETEDVELLREVTDGYLQLLEWSEELRPAGEAVEELIAKLCERVLVSAEQQSELDPESVESRLEFARTLARLAGIEGRLELMDDALEHLDHAVELLTELRAADPENAELEEASREFEGRREELKRAGG